jgi:hypothetical protein
VHPRFYRAGGWSHDGEQVDLDIGGAVLADVRYVRALP